MALEREDRDKIHRIIFDLMREITNAPKLIPKQKEMTINQLRFLEQEICQEQPQPQLVHNSIEDFEKSFPWLKEKLEGISRHPYVRELLKDIKPNKKKRFFF
jgi:uncharacterized protein YllA (UPF0747 family)